MIPGTGGTCFFCVLLPFQVYIKARLLRTRYLYFVDVCVSTHHAGGLDPGCCNVHVCTSLPVDTYVAFLREVQAT